jgi:lysozyme family protein
MGSFEAVVEALKTREGGYVNNPRDPGGQTKYGISRRSYPNEDIPNLTWQRAKQLYHRDFWLDCKLDELPAKLRPMIMDAAVHHGKVKAIKFLQKALNVTADGIIGPQTIRAANTQDCNRLAERVAEQRLTLLRNLETYSTFGRGWERRIATVKQECARIEVGQSTSERQDEARRKASERQDEDARLARERLDEAARLARERQSEVARSARERQGDVGRHAREERSQYHEEAERCASDEEFDDSLESSDSEEVYSHAFLKKPRWI